MDRGYSDGDIDDQVDRVKGLGRASLLSRQQEPKENTRITLVLTYHPALHKVYEILRQSENILCVDEEHRAVFRDKIFISFRKAKSLKDNLVRAKLQPLEEELVEKETSRCNARKSCQLT